MDFQPQWNDFAIFLYQLSRIASLIRINPPARSCMGNVLAMSILVDQDRHHNRRGSFKQNPDAALTEWLQLATCES
jgi:hypothetical protein